MAKALQRGRAARAAVEARLQRKGMHGAPVSEWKTVSQHAAPQAGERPRGGGAFSGWRGDGEGGKPFAADADSRVRRAIFDKNGGLQVRAARLSRETFCECIMAVWCRPSSTRRASAVALSKSATLTIGSTGISCSQVTCGRSPPPRLSAGEGARRNGETRRRQQRSRALPTSFFAAPSGRQTVRRVSASCRLNSSASKSCICWIRRSATEATTIRLFRRYRAGCNRRRRR